MLALTLNFSFVCLTLYDYIFNTEIYFETSNKFDKAYLFKAVTVLSCWRVLDDVD